MRRDEIIKGTFNVADALDRSNALVLFNFPSEKDNHKLSDVMNGYYIFKSRYDKFGVAEKEVMDAFKLKGLTQTVVWEALVQKESGGRQDIRGISRGLYFFVSYWKDMVELLSIKEYVKEDDSQANKLASSSEIEIFIRDAAPSTLSVRVFTEILKCVDELCDAIASVYEISAAEIIVNALDSGSDKKITLSGPVPVIESVKTFLFQAWDRIRFNDQHKTLKDLEVVGREVDLLVKIEEQQEKGRLTAETAEVLRRKVIGSSNSLASNGVYTQEMIDAKRPTPAELPPPVRPKLISHDPESAHNSARKSSGRAKKKPNKPSSGN